MKQEYLKLKKKYSLPDYNLLNKEFEIQAIDLATAGLPIKAILRAIMGKLGLFANYIEIVISPINQTIHSLVEVNNTSEENRKEMYNFYKKLSFLIHEMAETELKEEKDVAKYINNFMKEWPEIKQKQMKYLNIIKEAWKKEETEEQDHLNYNYTG